VILGMTTFTFIHVALSVVGIGSGSSRRVPALFAMAPTQAEPPFVVTQLVIMVLFVWLAIAVAKRFRPDLHEAPRAL
jgi:hypothetical protein